MDLGSLAAALRQPHLRARFQLLSDLQAFLRLRFLHAATQIGLLEALRAPATKADLVERLQIARTDLFDVLLDLGVAVKELSRRGDRYAIRGGRARVLTGADGDVVSAVLREFIEYHGSVYDELPARLRGAPSGDYLQQFGTVVARSSRIFEPFIGRFVARLVRRGGRMRLLEVGCGSGIYLRYAAEANAQLTGVAVDLQQPVVSEALANLREWGVSERFRVIVADIRQPPPEAAGPFDLITLHNNVYYFEPEERPELFRRLRSTLAPDGALALTTMMCGDTPASLDLDLGLRSTAGCTALPALPDVVQQLNAGGLTRVRHEKLMPLEPLYGIVARP